MWHLPRFTKTAFIVLALDSVPFTVLFQLPGHINATSSGKPSLVEPLLRMTLSFPYTPSSHCQQLSLIQLFLLWSVVGCLRFVLPAGVSFPHLAWGVGS